MIAACMLTMNVLIQRSWEDMLRSEIETSLREKTYAGLAYCRMPPTKRVRDRSPGRRRRWARVPR